MICCLSGTQSDGLCIVCESCTVVLIAEELSACVIRPANGKHKDASCDSYHVASAGIIDISRQLSRWWAFEFDTRCRDEDRSEQVVLNNDKEQHP